eukprot:CAMPEP_0113254430 /NCGR_PEP_ID=MMETSP0008_2-20120614/13699_1 /TAXON_ID=97485 /ORGANISM="Prymnesium parvum" /LENGTH=112 /DNA_ID=CAMNT_0000102651 /DNA_START=60 /DNA_END=400 /DNA_ORIENTATION=- /assembly_acc=CAM_ASM_000153
MPQSLEARATQPAQTAEASGAERKDKAGGLGDASRGEKLDIRHVPEEGERHRDARLYDVEDTIAAKSRSERETAATTLKRRDARVNEADGLSRRRSRAQRPLRRQIEVGVEE